MHTFSNDNNCINHLIFIQKQMFKQQKNQFSFKRIQVFRRLNNDLYEMSFVFVWFLLTICTVWAGCERANE